MLIETDAVDHKYQIRPIGRPPTDAERAAVQTLAEQTFVSLHGAKVIISALVEKGFTLTLSASAADSP